MSHVSVLLALLQVFLPARRWLTTHSAEGRATPALLNSMASVWMDHGQGTAALRDKPASATTTISGFAKQLYPSRLERCSVVAQGFLSWLADLCSVVLSLTVTSRVNSCAGRTASPVHPMASGAAAGKHYWVICICVCVYEGEGNMGVSHMKHHIAFCILAEA